MRTEDPERDAEHEPDAESEHRGADRGDGAHAPGLDRVRDPKQAGGKGGVVGDDRHDLLDVRFLFGC